LRRHLYGFLCPPNRARGLEIARLHLPRIFLLPLFPVSLY
jgi:hypothetical protein